MLIRPTVARSIKRALKRVVSYHSSDTSANSVRMTETSYRQASRRSH